MNVIFLDIDGVLNSTKTANPRKFPYIVDGRMVGRLNELTAIARATVVLSSSWRVDPIGCLAAKHFGIHFDDVCPDMPKAARSEEIRCWLDRHPDARRHIVMTTTTIASTIIRFFSRYQVRVLPATWWRLQSHTLMVGGQPIYAATPLFGLLSEFNLLFHAIKADAIEQSQLS